MVSKPTLPGPLCSGLLFLSSSRYTLSKKKGCKFSICTSPVSSSSSSHWLKITQNVSYESCHFHQFFPYVKLTCLVTLFDHKFNIRKISQINHFCIFDKLLFPKCKRSSLRSQCCKNETFSAIFQHRVLLLFFSFSSCCRPYK